MIANSRFQESSGRAGRKGLVSVAVLIGLIIIGLICAGLLKVALSRRAEVALEERRVQAGWLAESGLDRASSRLATSGEYSGETWEIPAEDLGGRGPAKVLIEIQAMADRADHRKVRVQADYPSGSSLRSRQTREIIVKITPPSR
jgi:type II secretory pathway pseudopilin PulG